MEKKEKKNEVVDAQVVSIQEEINKKTEELKKCLQELSRKQELNDHRSRFIAALDSLAKMEEEVEKVTDFETKSHAVRFFYNHTYRIDDAILSISNPAIVMEIISFIREKIINKVEKIEKELIK